MQITRTSNNHRDSQRRARASAWPLRPPKSLELVRVLVKGQTPFHDALSYAKPGYELVIFLINQGGKVDDGIANNSPIGIRAKVDDQGSQHLLLAFRKKADIVTQDKASQERAAWNSST